jgi:hypothetical protein
VRGPDPDNDDHYASGEATNADVANESTLDLKGRIAAAKKQARAYINRQIAVGSTKKTKAILDAEILAALTDRNVGIAADAAVRFVKRGDRFSYIGDVWRVTRVARGPQGIVTMARESPDPSDRFEKVVLIDDREFPRRALREMAKIV